MTVWHDRWMVLIITALVTFAGLMAVLHFASYKSEGFFQFGGAFAAIDNDGKEKSSGISLSDYKLFVASYATSERFSDYVKDKKLDHLPGMDDLRKKFNSGASIEKMIQPVYPFTRLDAKLLGDQPKDSSNDVIGLQIAVENANPQKAQLMTWFLGHYVMDSIIYFVYSDFLRFMHSETVAKMVKLDNVIIVNNENLEEYARKAADLKQILKNIPASASMQSQQIVSVTVDSARYLSPVTQLATTQVQTSETNENIRKTRREQKQTAVLLEYYTQAEGLLHSTKSGETILRKLDGVKDRVFKDKNLSDESVKEIYNIISIRNQNAINVYLEKSRFIAGPTLPEKSSARPFLAFASSLLAGLFLSIMAAFVRKWWRENKLTLVR